MNGLSISPFIADLPKVELHVHIEGTLTPTLRWELAHRNNVSLPYSTFDELKASYAVTLNHRPELNGRQPGIPTFLEAYFAGCEVLRTEDDFYDLAMAYLRRCTEMNVRYTEPFFDIQAHTRRGVPAPSVLNGYLRAQHDAKEQFNVRSRWVLCFLRDEPVEDGLAAYREARPWAAGIVEGGKGLFHAVGLASNAYERPPMLFEEGFNLARADGLHITMHCDFGQKDTYAHLNEAIFRVCEGRGSERIDHGLDAEDREELWQGLRDRNIGLTLCPHAYHRRTATEVLFPKIRRLWENGVKICINSDDPTLMHDVWIDGNMQKVYTYGGFSKVDMVRLARNAVDMSWAVDDVKRSIYDELERVDVS
ncbi:Adenosine/adenine deaminase [Penicillium argentinense]|uniref:Adenosine/adenine deaminase n=1 Tax=Penicillium argentinense TaxID=1131581 RepID=A0A9W9FME8_9EURO|nr:Adenosine/adenine deaminase [Penicillium argentinense]KAJ5102813.1 Adenosine/adenine deaminase [Penicillium argentinense]